LSSLRREVGLPGAVFMGLGSIVGTGLFVSLGIAAGVAGTWILLALPLAALLALANGLSSAQLAAAHPVSGGSYEYGYRFLNPALGFTAGWTFLLAKGASAATAALGFAGYLLLLGEFETSRWAIVGVGTAVTVGVTVLVAGGIQWSNRANQVIVGFTLLALGVFIVAGLPSAMEFLTGTGATGGEGGSSVADPEGGLGGMDGLPFGPLLHATALLFVAYTGYGRIATLGEEVRTPEATIPRAIWITLWVVALLYFAVAAVALGALGAEGFAGATAETAAPLQAAAAALGVPGIATLVALAAVTAMLGVLLNLILGLSRVALAMGRRGDLPGGLAAIHGPSGSPRAAVIVTGAVILALVLLGDVRTTWSFAAFAVLLYYGVTNLAALRLPPELRLYPRWVAVAGLVGCLFLAFQVEVAVWGAGVVVVGVGLLWHRMRTKVGPGRFGANPPSHRGGAVD
jgi:basic amino acid/polyamine antiporter, APA family